MTTSTELLANGVPKPIPTPTTRLENRRRALEIAERCTNRDDVVRTAREFAAFLDEHPMTDLPPVVLAELDRQRLAGFGRSGYLQLLRDQCVNVARRGDAINLDDAVSLVALALLALEA